MGGGLRAVLVLPIRGNIEIERFAVTSPHVIITPVFFRAKITARLFAAFIFEALRQPVNRHTGGGAALLHPVHADRGAQALQGGRPCSADLGAGLGKLLGYRGDFGDLLPAVMQKAEKDIKTRQI